MDLKLTGKAALISGSNANIGTAIAWRLAREGAVVVVHGRNAERARNVMEQIRAEGLAAHIAIGDLVTDAGAEAVAAAAIEAAGGIDILINNAGTHGDTSWDSLSSADWVNRINDNLISAVRLSKLLVPAMAERGWGRVIQVGSIAQAAPNLNYGDYAASKAGMMSLTVGLAQHYGLKGVTANSIGVGTILTDSLEVLQRVAKEKSCSVEEAERLLCTSVMRNATGRLGRVEEIADAITFLCSPLAGFITGANLRVDGGYITTINP